jgi:hypothetical protein
MVNIGYLLAIVFGFYLGAHYYCEKYIKHISGKSYILKFNRVMISGLVSVLIAFGVVIID